MDTLVQTCRARERLGTLKIQLPRVQRDGCVCVSLCCGGRETSGTRRVMARDLEIVVGKLETLAFL